MSKKVWISLLVVAALGSGALADQLDVISSQDSYIYNYEGITNYGGNWLMGLVSETTGEGRVRSLVQFDLSSLDSLTTQATGASLSLMTLWPGGSTGTMDLNLYRILKPWVQGTGNGATTGPGVTWIDRDRGSTTWSACTPYTTGLGAIITNEMLAGVDYEATPFATAVSTPSLGTGSILTFDLSGSAALAVVQDWIENPSSNYGFMIMAENPTGDHLTMNFFAREVWEDAKSPHLIVDYVVPEPATMGLLAVGGLGLLFRKKR